MHITKVLRTIFLLLFSNFRSVKYPMKPKLKMRFVITIIITIICLAVTVAVPNIYHTGYEKYLNGKYQYHCIYFYSKEFNKFFYYLLISIIFVLMPMTVIAIAHISMWRHIQKQPKLESSSEEAKRQLKLRKISKTFQLIVYTYFFMTLPHLISVLVLL